MKPGALNNWGISHCMRNTPTALVGKPETNSQERFQDVYFIFELIFSQKIFLTKAPTPAKPTGRALSVVRLPKQASMLATGSRSD
jgi:hypothetical protein